MFAMLRIPACLCVVLWRSYQITNHVVIHSSGCITSSAWHTEMRQQSAIWDKKGLSPSKRCAMGIREEEYQDNIAQVQDNSLHRKHFYTQKLLHTEAFTHKNFHTQKLLHTDIFTQRRFYTQRLVHTDAFTHKPLLHTKAFTHRPFYTQTLLHTDTFTHRSFHT